MKRDRVAEIYFYEWRIAAWATSETRDRLNASGRGIYRELLDHCYGQGKFPDDPEWICRRCACTPEELEKVWKIISRHFPKIGESEYRSNVFADLFRSGYFEYVDRQRSNREGKSRKFNEIHNGGETTDNFKNNGGGTKTKRNETKRNENETKQNDNRQSNDTSGGVNGTAEFAATTDRWNADELSIGRWLSEYPGVSALQGAPDLTIVRQCLEVGSKEQIHWALRELGIERKAPARSWAWFPVALASKITRREA